MITATPMGKLFEEIKRRRVIRVATLYVVAFWPIIQIVDIASPALGLSDVVMRYLVIAMLGGLPIALTLAWVFDINRDGISVTGPDESGGTSLLGERNEVVLIGVLIAFIIGLFAVQAWMGEEESVFRTTGAPVAAVPVPTIAVLPFVAFSELGNDQQFADGLTEELLNVLARVKGLRVAARTSSFAYKDVNRKVTEIATELNVGTILEGSVRRNDVSDDIRVTAQLIDGRTGSHYWSRVYTRKFEDIFRIQDDIAKDVASELKLTLLQSQQPVARNVAPEAMVMLKVARDEMARRSEVGIRDAIRFFTRAAEREPEYAEAHAGIAQAHLLLASYGYSNEKASLAEARTAIATAIALAPDLGVVVATQGLLQAGEGDKTAAKATLERAMSLNPSDAMAVMWYASLLDSPAEQLRWYQKAYELDPRSPVVSYNVANLLIDQGRDHEAMVFFERIVEADPYYHGAYELAARVNERRGRLDEAVAQLEKAYEFQPSMRIAVNLAEIFLDIGDDDSSDLWIGKAADSAVGGDAPRIDWLRVQQWITRGDRDAAIVLLRQKMDVPANAPLPAHLDGLLAAYYAEDDDEVVNRYMVANNIAAYSNWTMHGFDELTVLEMLLGASHSLQRTGNSSQAIAVLDYVRAKLAQYRESGFTPPEVFYLDALVAAETGNRQMMLINLQRAMDEGWHQHWRPGVEPILAVYREDAAFESMLGALTTRMKLMREQLQFASAFDEGWGA